MRASWGIVPVEQIIGMIHDWIALMDSPHERLDNCYNVGDQFETEAGNRNMHAKDAIRTSVETADYISKAYLEDLTDDEMMHRPHPKCNHIKWQLGHLIASDHKMVNGCCPGALPDLPAGFVEKYAKEKSGSDKPGDFHSKSELMELFDGQRAAALAKLAELSDEELNAASPEEIRAYAPNFGAAFGMLGLHWTMHSGQWAVIRRQLGREPVM